MVVPFGGTPLNAPTAPPRLVAGTPLTSPAGSTPPPATIPPPSTNGWWAIRAWRLSLDIDHLVPLAKAWDSGASVWSAAEREAYANDLGDDRALIAVSAASNRSKADQDPSTWLPPAAGYRCQYATDWIADKTRWNLSIDATKEAALTGELSRCPNVPITVTTAR
ncbi:HNH endonuclease family protein [Streptomyces sp. NPDC014793]|uniref:HNH endonuclease family protein n=1 Tax=Streptomyces sp. NPDC014793 TaxID=3364914 RepID=UPI0037005E25